VLDPANWPDWFQALRLLVAFVLTAGFGLHAYYQHRQESIEAVSPRKWMYWMYSMVFLLASTATFAQLCVTLVFRDYSKAPFHLGYSTVVLVLSYLALMGGARRRHLD